MFFAQGFVTAQDVRFTSHFLHQPRTLFTVARACILPAKAHRAQIRLVHQRLWHMDQDRQRGLGRFAEWVGTSGVAQDKLIRTLGLEHAAKADYAVSRTLYRIPTRACHAR